MKTKMLKLLSHMTGCKNDDTNFPHKSILTNRQISNFHKAFANNSSTNIKLSETK